MNEYFYTLKGYKLRDNNYLTDAMEDYLEMIYRISINNSEIHVKEISEKLNVRASSVSKMLNKLKLLKLVSFEKYGSVTLTNEGQKIGKYLFERHSVLVNFFKKLNKDDYNLDQVEKIEHFIDEITIENIKKSL